MKSCFYCFPIIFPTWKWIFFLGALLFSCRCGFVLGPHWGPGNPWTPAYGATTLSNLKNACAFSFTLMITRDCSRVVKVSAKIKRFLGYMGPTWDMGLWRYRSIHPSQPQPAAAKHPEHQRPISNYEWSSIGIQLSFHQQWYDLNNRMNLLLNKQLLLAATDVNISSQFGFILALYNYALLASNKWLSSYLHTLHTAVVAAPFINMKYMKQTGTNNWTLNTSAPSACIHK